MPRKTPKPATSSEKKCVFCHLSDDNELKYGKIYEHDGIVTHYYCLLLSSNMQQRGRDEDGILGFLAVDIQTELKRGRRLICSYCKKNGATLGCCNVKCKKVFHYPCGIKNNTLHQFYGEYKSFCVLHRPKRNIDPKIQKETPEHLMCYICYDHVHRENIYQTLWAPCCKKNAWFHRDCVQQLALSAGYFFKCPLCNNKKEFQKAMLDSGIFVPSQDASWELVPNAFQELLYRHNKCDAAKCSCPHGREYTSTNARWELILCRTCGSQGIHMGCGNLKWIDPVWDCDECSTILSKNGTYQNPNHEQRNENDDSAPISSTLSRQSDGESSDSDVSIGTEFPMNEKITSVRRVPIILRPGPRSAKLKQLLRHAETSTIETSASNASLEQLKDILNEQQAHHSISDQVPSSEVSACLLPLNTDVNKPENATPSSSLTRAIEDVILVDSDEDDATKQPATLSMNKSSISNSVPDRTISYMNIQISQVTSLPPEVFASVPDTPITSGNTRDASLDPSQSTSPTYLMKRKADSIDVVSQIVQCINNSLDSPNITAKRQRVENNTNLFNTPDTPIPSERHSILRGVPSASYRNGVSLSQAAIVTVNGKEFVVPLERVPNIPSSTTITAATNPTQSNSDGDAGTKRVDCEGVVAGDGTADSTKTDEHPTGRGCDGHGIKQSTMCKQLHDDESSSWDSGTRINRNRLMRNKVRLRDLKFYIYTNDTITMNYRDKLTMNIAVETMRERETVNNRAFFPNRINSRWASRVRGSDSHQNNNKKDDCLCRCVSDNETIILKNCDGASDSRDSRILPKNTTHSLVNRNINDLCKYQLKESTKDNLVPDMFGHTNNVNPSEKLTSFDQTSERYRYENNENNVVTSRNYSNAIGAASNPGTSRDELRRLTISHVNQRRFTSSSNKYTYGNWKLINWRRKSLSSYFDQDNIRCRVSIDLDRIQSIFNEIPNFLLEKNVSTYHRSFDDLRMCSAGRTAKVRDCNSFGSLTRSKSESNVSSMYNNSNPSKTSHKYIPEMHLNDLKKRIKVRKRNVQRHTIM